MLLSTVTAQKQIAPAASPKKMAPIGPAQPQAGVIATRPATAPEAPPSMLGLPRNSHSAPIQAKVAAALASKVLTKTNAARPLASRLEPTLKPNQPTHNNEAPIMVIVTLCGASDSFLKPIRLPIIKQPTKPARPALICTTVPPAKSSAPFWNKKPAVAVAASAAEASV